MSGSAAVAQEHPSDASPLLRMSAIDLRPLPTAVPSARLHARHVLVEWGLRSIASDGELLVSELVTNAVTHGIASMATAAGPADVPPVRLRLAARPGRVQIEVWDAGEDLPRACADPADEQTGGRGLILVAALAARWGAYRTEGGGKCVWAVLST